MIPFTEMFRKGKPTDMKHRLWLPEPGKSENKE